MANIEKPQLESVQLGFINRKADFRGSLYQQPHGFSSFFKLTQRSDSIQAKRKPIHHTAYRFTAVIQLLTQTQLLDLFC